jgi:ApbE superfamily uncharacterized protein (UPF0280 family)
VSAHSASIPPPLAEEGREGGLSTSPTVQAALSPSYTSPASGGGSKEDGGGGRPTARFLSDGRRLHLQHGPIDLVIEAWGTSEEVARAYRQAWARFQDVLATLVAELKLLRRRVDEHHPGVAGPVARRMLAACRAHAPVFITPMAAVAGAVADEILAALVAGRALKKAYVNNGGDIALYLAPGASLALGVIGDLAVPAIDALTRIDAAMPVRGVATSGRGGRSFSLGIADAVTILARDGAAADAAATLVANAVDLDHPAIERRPACALDPDSDLGERLVTVGVGALDEASIAFALDRGAATAEAMCRAGLIQAAVLQLRQSCRVVGGGAVRLAPAT